MKACDQTTDHSNLDQFLLYEKLILEEVTELRMSSTQEERLDALIDIMVVTVGAIHSMGADGEGAWKEVMRSNFSKIGENGKVRKREDGKVLKPPGYSPPQLAPFITKK